MSKILSDKSELPETTEVSRDDALALILKDDALMDVKLRGNDGVMVGACRSVLAARSVIFHRMLFGSFSEATKTAINIDYKGSVLTAIVEYIHTDTAELLTLEKGQQDFVKIAQQIQELVSLTGAALYFNLPSLCEKAFDVICRSLEQDPSLSFAVLEACHQRGTEAPSIGNVIA